MTNISAPVDDGLVEKVADAIKERMSKLTVDYTFKFEYSAFQKMAKAAIAAYEQAKQDEIIELCKKALERLPRKDAKND